MIDNRSRFPWRSFVCHRRPDGAASLSPIVNLFSREHWFIRAWLFVVLRFADPTLMPGMYLYRIRSVGIGLRVIESDSEVDDEWDRRFGATCCSFSMRARTPDRTPAIAPGR
jgi:hypothetical protein